MHVVLVDDDVTFSLELALALENQSFKVSLAHSYSDLEKILKQTHVDVILLDVGLPDLDGFSILQRLHLEFERTGVVMLTARTELGDRIRGLATGADAYLSKPVNVAEISATIHAVGRRLNVHREGKETKITAWRIENSGWVVISADAERYELTAQERHFVLSLHDGFSKGRAVSRRELMLQLGKNPDIYDDHFLDSLVSRLRSKLGKSFPLQTIRGVGYTLSESIQKLD
ncbi:response regulator transcription factor [Gilvimarinus sp. 1_MG-2023]|uniref:response regulator transcription factor n=1 Tax=Gilvimarinus sp. 1_MG-2023 TaxID=3062638 RepID=UPI0026E40988|nr:response regulator transcription factor [Gilvimarinus sp. 1_MG-2023]MDO6746565.1 response regulator transcription factor [Gilvimarinus sp. 1_MG-2023]